MNVKGYKLLKQQNCLTSDNYKTQTINDQRAVVTLGNRASYEHALSSVKRILDHFLWDPLTLISGQKKLVAWLINDTFLKWHFSASKLAQGANYSSNAFLQKVSEN